MQTGAPEGQEPISAIHLRTLLENMDAVMFQTELSAGGELHVAYSSHSLLSGEYEKLPKENSGEGIWNSIFPEDLEELQNIIREATISGTTVDHICRVYNLSGKIEWRHIRGTQLPNSKDGIRRMIHVATDVSLQTQSESELREKDSIIDFAMRNTDVNLWYFDYEKNECQLTKSCQKAHEMLGVEALYYTFDIDYEKNMGFLVEQLLTDDYEFLGLLDTATGRLMVFGENMDDPLMARNGGMYEEEMQKVFSGLILKEYYEEGIRTMALDHVRKELETKEFYTCSFPACGYARSKAGRKQWKFAYLDDSKSKIMMSRTDITSIYTAERDPLTGLYNRETFYRRTKAVLEANPEHPFLVIRFDIDRFKAYNDVYGV